MSTDAYPEPILWRKSPLPHHATWWSSVTAEAAIEFGHFQVLFRPPRLLADGAPVEIGTRGFDLLLLLLEAHGALVTKRELLNRVWPSAVVSQENLKVHVSALRKILGPDASADPVRRGAALAVFASVGLHGGRHRASRSRCRAGHVRRRPPPVRVDRGITTMAGGSGIATWAMRGTRKKRSPDNGSFECRKLTVSYWWKTQLRLFELAQYRAVSIDREI
jgi:hypothetical protein